ncbi:unnamed protein product, partial [Trichogramma brassicae]
MKVVVGSASDSYRGLRILVNISAQTKTKSCSCMTSTSSKSLLKRGLDEFALNFSVMILTNRHRQRTKSTRSHSIYRTRPSRPKYNRTYNVISYLKTKNLMLQQQKFLKALEIKHFKVSNSTSPTTRSGWRLRPLHRQSTAVSRVNYIQAIVTMATRRMMSFGIYVSRHSIWPPSWLALMARVKRCIIRMPRA